MFLCVDQICVNKHLQYQQQCWMQMDLTHQFHSPLIRLEQGEDERGEADWATVMGDGDGAIGGYVENDEGMSGERVSRV